MPKCTANEMDFGRLGRRVIEADFSGGAIGSDGGVMLLRQVDRRIGLSAAVAAALADPRDANRITHSLRDLVAQRLYGLCCGYEDLNDHERLRHDPLMQTAVGKVTGLASAPTFSRLETGATRADVVAFNRVLIEQFVASHRKAPAELILDIDASDVPLHGDQEHAQFHGCYDHYCYLPLYGLLRPSHARLRVAPFPYRRGEARRCRDQAPGDAPASSLAQGSSYRARRFRFLPPVPAALARAQTGGLRHRGSAQCAPASAG
jgi:hypothetical protein